MKKKFTTLFMFAATMLVTLTFTACGEEVNIDGPNTPVETKTVFTSIDDDTRTSIDNKRWFMWEPGDKIWVKNGGTWIDSNPTDITSAQSKAKFVFDAKTLTMRYDSMKIAQTNIRMLIESKGVEVHFPSNTTGVAGYLDVKPKSVE